jgi:hypothetical protein
VSGYVQQAGSQEGRQGGAGAAAAAAAAAAAVHAHATGMQHKHACACACACAHLTRRRGCAACWQRRCTRSWPPSCAHTREPPAAGRRAGRQCVAGFETPQQQNQLRQRRRRRRRGGVQPAPAAGQLAGCLGPRSRGAEPQRPGRAPARSARRSMRSMRPAAPTHLRLLWGGHHAGADGPHGLVGHHHVGPVGHADVVGDGPAAGTAGRHSRQQRVRASAQQHCYTCAAPPHLLSKHAHPEPTF